MAWAKQLPESDRDSAVKNANKGWADKDPAAAAVIAAQLHFGETRSEVVQVIASNWASNDPVAALTWAQQLPESESGGALESVVKQWIRKDRDAALRWVDQLPPGPMRDRLGTISGQ